MKQQILVSSEKCIGCTLCALTCSLAFHKEYNPALSYIKIKKDDFNGTVDITFSPNCVKCGQCIKACPSECLTLANDIDASKDQLVIVNRNSKNI